MAKRFVTAREQFELLSPWRIAMSDIDPEYNGELKRQLEPSSHWVVHIDGERVVDGAASEDSATMAAMDIADKKNLSLSNQGGKNFLVDGNGNVVHHVEMFDDQAPGWKPNHSAARTAAIHDQLMQIVAMADTTPWHPLIQDTSHFSDSERPDRPRDRSYVIGNPDPGRITDQPIAQLDVTLHNKGNRQWKSGEDGFGGGYVPREHNEAYINSIIVHPEFQGQGIAQALIERLNKDYPEHKINPGVTTPKGYGLVERLKKIVPDSEEKMSPDYKPYVMDDEESSHYEKYEYANVGHDDYEYDDYTSEYNPRSRQLVNASYDDGPYWGAGWDDEDEDDEDDWPEGTVPKQHKKRGTAELMNAPHYLGIDEDPYVGKHRKEEEPSRLKKWLKSWNPDQVALDLSRKRVATQQFLAMAWQDWAPKIQHNEENATWGKSLGMYKIPHEDESGNYYGVSKLHYQKDPSNKQLNILWLGTNSRHRNDGLAESLIRRMHEDHPDYRISPGVMLDDGRAFHDRMLEKEPQAKELVTARFWHAAASEIEIAPHYNPDFNMGYAAQAWDGDKLVGHLTWNGKKLVKKGIPPEVGYVAVHPDYRRQGIGTSLINWARENKEPNLNFNDWLSKSGKGLAESMGYVPKNWSEEEADGSDEDDDEWLPGGRFDLTKQQAREDLAEREWFKKQRAKRMKLQKNTARFWNAS